MLGTNWSKEKLKAIQDASGDSNESDEFLVPLSVILDPQLIEKITPSSSKFVGGKPVSGDSPESLMKMSKEDFLKYVGKGHQLEMTKKGK